MTFLPYPDPSPLQKSHLSSVINNRAQGRKEKGEEEEGGARLIKIQYITGKYNGKTPLNRGLNNEGQESRPGHVRGKALAGG
jgi:hypothetical protein